MRAKYQERKFTHLKFRTLEIVGNYPSELAPNKIIDFIRGGRFTILAFRTTQRWYCCGKISEKSISAKLPSAIVIELSSPILERLVRDTLESYNPLIKVLLNQKS